MIGIILGTRPEIIKMSPIIRECRTIGYDYFILHTGQHYSYEMDRTFFEELELPTPKYNLDIGSGSHAEQTGKIMIGIEKILMREKPDILLVQGDTNSVLAGALAGSKLGIPIGHVEAGLRSFDRSMPEEINRIIADHISNYLFAPTETARQYLLKEGIDAAHIHVTGNTIVDAVFQNLELSKLKSKILIELGIKPREYFLVTIHRQENVDSPINLKNIISALDKIQKNNGYPIIFPMHPRTRKMVDLFEIPLDGFFVIPPIGFLDFLQLESNACLIFTDSGGVQEEACILNVPCVTLRENTERPETILVGANILAGMERERIIVSSQKFLSKTINWIHPYGDGKAGEKICAFCNYISSRNNAVLIND